MKSIKVNLKDNKTIACLKDILLIMMAITLLFLAIAQEKIQYNQKEIVCRYEQIKEDNTNLIKENQELNKMLKDTFEQDNITNNIETRY